MTSNTHRRNTELFELVEPVCADAGYELVDIELSQGPQGYILRVYVDYPPESGKAIGLSECEAVSRELSALFDVEDPIATAYSLEVSSPGIDRPLRSAEHFSRAVGEEAKISLLEGLDGRRNFRGRLIQVEIEENDSIVTLEVDGVEYRLPLHDVATARIVPDYDALMKRARN